MKFEELLIVGPGEESHPARGAWIEIPFGPTGPMIGPSHPARGAWIEMARRCRRTRRNKSHPARGAWIEIWSR